MLLALGTQAGPAQSAANQEQSENSLMQEVLLLQTQEQADAKSKGCVSCHTATDSPTMHTTGTVRLGCVDCHTGDPSVFVPPGAAMGSEAYEQAKRQGHPKPRFPENARTSANPVRAYTKWLK